MALDLSAPKIEEICLIDRKLVVDFSEPVDPIGVGQAFRIDGADTTWSIDSSGLTAELTSSLPNGSYTLEVVGGSVDYAGGAIANAPGIDTLSVDGANSQIFVGDLPAVQAASAIGNDFGFHGLHHDDESGLVFARRRYLDPELGRFTSTDPYGYVDGPSMYQYALNNPTSYSDPTGEVAVLLPFLAKAAASGLAGVGLGWSINKAFGLDYDRIDSSVDFALGAATFGVGVGVKGLVTAGRLGRAGALGTSFAAEVVLTGLGEGARSGLRGERMTLAQAARGGFIGATAGYVLPVVGSRLAMNSRRTASRFVSFAKRLQDEGRPRYSLRPMNSLYAPEFRAGGIFPERVQYLLEDSERLPFLMEAVDGQVRVNGATDIENRIYVMSGAGDIYISPNHGIVEVDGDVFRIQHSTFLAGADVAAAGEISVRGGSIHGINRESGHYGPSELHLQQVVDQLRERGIPVPEGVIEWNLREQSY